MIDKPQSLRYPMYPDQDRRGGDLRTPPGSKGSNGKENPSGAAGILIGSSKIKTARMRGFFIQL